MNSSNQSSARYFPYFLPTVIFLSVFAGCLALGPFLFNVDGDLGRHLTIGKVILDRGSIPTIDEFSHTRFGDPFSPHEWMAELIFRLCYDWLGLSGVVLFTAALLGLVFFLLTYRVFQITRSTPITLILIVVGIAASRIHWLARPHIFTYLFLLLWVELLNSQIQFRWKLAWSAVIMLLWVNTHGAFVSGIAITGIYLLGSVLHGILIKDWKTESRKSLQYLLILLLSLGVSLINPDGIRIWYTIYGFLSSRYLVSHTAEYMAPILYETGVIPFTLMLAISLLFLTLFWKRLTATRIMLLLVFGIFGITSGRNIPLFILVSLPILAECAGSLLPRFKLQLDQVFDNIHPDQERRSTLFVFPVVLTILMMGFGMIIFRLQPGLSDRNQYSPSRYPVQAVDWLIEHPQNGRFFNDFMWGGYILYRNWPQTLVFIDGQTDFYGEALTRDYETIINGWDGWVALLEKYQVTKILVPHNASLVNSLEASGSWQIIYSDETAVMYSVD